MKLVKFWLCAIGLLSVASTWQTAQAVDVTPPVFDTLSYVARDASNVDKAAIGGIYYLKENDRVFFTIQIDPADTMSATNTVDFTIGGTPTVFTPFNPSPDPATAKTRNRNYFISAGENGPISITGVTFTDDSGNAITGLPPFPIDPLMVVDTNAPGILFTDDVSNSVTSSDNVTVTVTDTNPNTSTFEYGLSADAICDGTDTYGNAFTSGVAFNFSTSANNGQYVCAKAEDNAGNISYQASGFALNIDDVPPVINFTDDVELGPIQSDDVEITVTELDPNLLSFEYGFSADAVCDATDTFGNAFTSGGTITFNTEVNNGQYVCAKAADNAGNVTYQSSFRVLNIDITPPTLTGVVQSTNNPYNDHWAKAGENVTYDLTFSENVTASINVASSAANITTLAQEIDVFKTNTDQLIFTAVAGDNGVVTPSVNFDITDDAGNTTTITSLGGITVADGSNPVETDTTIPVLNTVNIASDNANSAAWAKSGDTITITTSASERLRSGIVQTVIGTIATEAATVTKLCAQNNCAGHTFTLLTDGNEAEGVVPFTIDFQDRAGNAGVQVTATTDASSVTIDNTAPTVTPVTIYSNNLLDNTLAKSNDTITVEFTVNDNLSTNAFIAGAPTILSSPAVANVTTVAAGQTISRFTDGSETSEVVVPFSFAVRDSAGNVSATTTATTDASQVKFDRTEPIVTNVGMTATSQDASAFLGDVPTYYARQNDTIEVSLLICDYVDSNNNPPTGSIFGTPVVFADQGLFGGPNNCVTGAGNLSQFRQWKGTLLNADGAEGLVPFSVDGKDNAGNVLVPSITVTTNGSSVIFDKTSPTVPTDMVDLGGAETLGYKPAPNADLYIWTNDDDPAGGAPRAGVWQFDVRYNNVNTGINEQVTITAPTRQFAPTLMIPDLAPYTVNMNVRDKAGNLSGEQVVYTQKYGIEVSGKVTDTDTNAPIPGAYVHLIAPSGSVCNLPDQAVCAGITDANGDYVLTVAPNTNYKIDGTKTPDYYIAKDDLVVTTADVVSNIKLKHVEDGETQTGNQGIIITLDRSFVDGGGKEQTTYLTVYTFSGEVTTNQTSDGLVITSFSTINQVESNDPNLVIDRLNDNTFIIRTPEKVLNTANVSNPGSSVSSTFTSGSNGVGARRVLGGASAGFQAGMRREDRVVNQLNWTYAESMAYAQKLNEGSDYKVNQYVNRNGFTVFAGYQHGRMAVSDMTGSNPNVRMQHQIVYRGPRRGSEATFRNVKVADRQEIVKDIFYTDLEKETEPAVLVVEEGNQQKAARPRVETKKTAMTYNNPEVTGYGKKVDVYASLLNKRENDDRYVNKFAKVIPEADVAPSRLQGKNVNIIVFRNEGRGENRKNLSVAQVFQNNPELINGRTSVARD